MPRGLLIPVEWRCRSKLNDQVSRLRRRPIVSDRRRYHHWCCALRARHAPHKRGGGRATTRKQPAINVAHHNSLGNEVRDYSHLFHSHSVACSNASLRMTADSVCSRCCFFGRTLLETGSLWSRRFIEGLARKSHAEGSHARRATVSVPSVAADHRDAC